MVTIHTVLRMERGEDWEYAAVQSRWATIRRQRRVTKRLVAAFLSGLLTVALFMLAATSEACVASWGVPTTCDPVVSGPVFDALVIAGTATLCGAVWFCLSALNIQAEYERNGC